MTLFLNPSAQGAPLPKEVILGHICPYLTLEDHRALGLVCSDSFGIARESFQRRMASIAHQNILHIRSHEALSKTNAIAAQMNPSLPHSETLAGTLTFVSDGDGEIIRLFPEFPSITESILKPDTLLFTFEKRVSQSEEDTDRWFTLSFYRFKKGKPKEVNRPVLDKIAEKMIRNLHSL